MKLATYNMMFGMYGRLGLLNVLGHLSFHGLKSPFLTRLFSRFNRKTAEIIGGLGADVISLQEVLGTLRKDKLIKDLRAQGFRYFCWGPANHHDFPLDIGTLIASKKKFKKINFKLVQASRPGGGGGGCAIYLERNNLIVLAVHLGLRKKLLVEQIAQISNFITRQKGLGKKVILLGDFNIEEAELNKNPSFKSLELCGANTQKTCPLILEISPFKFKCVDNIFFSKGLKLKDSEVFNGKSDHRGAWAEFVK